MKDYRNLLAAALLALALPLAARAEPAAPAIDITVGTSTVTDAQEAADQKIVSAALGDFNRGGFSALEKHLAELREIMTRAPVSYPVMERRGQRIIIRVDDSAHYLMLSLLAASGAAKEQHVEVVQGPNTYPTAALLLASHADEMHSYDEGARWANKGLAMQPYNWMLTLEAAACTMALHHPDESYRVLKDALDHGGLLLTNEAKARLLRNQGSALIELNRLDEAEAAERESIRLMPDNPVARNELSYITKLRAGAPATDVIIAVPNPPPEQGDPPSDKGN